MCGIVGALAFGEFETKKEEKLRQEAMIFLTTELLQLTQIRGKEATGIATMFANCDYIGLKMGVSAQEFVARFGGTEKDYEGYLNLWRKKTSPAKMVIGHCRKPSTGGAASPDDNKNNHPIKVGDIVGVHNGTLQNHEKIFTNLDCGRDGKVDSEAIFRLLHHYTNNGQEPFTAQAIQETCKRLDGQYCCLTFSGNNPYQLAAFRDGRPLEAMLIRPLKLMLLASEKDFLNAALFRYNKMANLYLTGANKFNSIRKDDVDRLMLADDSLFLFDVRDEVEDKTLVNNLYVTEKIPRAGKIWQKTVYTKKTNTTANTTQVGTGTTPPANPNTAAPGTKKATVSASNPNTTVGTHSGASGGNTCDSNERRLGMAWNRANNTYESINGLVLAGEHGNVEIDIEDEKVVDVTKSNVIKPGQKKQSQQSTSANGNREATKHSFTESTTPVDDLIADPAKISEIPVAEVSAGESKTTGAGAGEVRVATEKTTPERDHKLLDYLKEHGHKINMCPYPDVVEKAVVANRDEPLFSNNTELANALEIKNKEAMQNMAFYSLANRVKAYFFKLGWYRGYIARLNEEDSPKDNNDLPRNMMIRARDKANRASRNIRHLKTLVRILTRVLKQYPGGAVDTHRLERAVIESFENQEEISSNVLKDVLREGDLKFSRELRSILYIVETKEETKEREEKL